MFSKVLFQYIQSLIDAKLILFKIDISFCNRKQLPDPAPVQNSSSNIRIISCSRLHCLYKLFVLVQYPEDQTSRIRISHSFHFLAWINRQIIDFSCMYVLNRSNRSKAGKKLLLWIANIRRSFFLAPFRHRWSYFSIINLSVFHLLINVSLFLIW